MVTRSLFTGVSGLQTHMQKMDSLSNNLSNLNTPGFKKSTVTFKSFLSQQVTAGSSPDVQGGVGGTNPQQVGLGVQMGSINLDMSQGQLQRTGINTDLAVQGEGFFTTKKSGSEQTLFTRAGSFQFDSQSQLVDPANGNVVQGYMADPEENFVLGTEGNPQDIKLTSAMRNMQAEATTNQLFEGNLSADQDTGIDSVKVSFTPEGSSNESEIRYDFKRFHPEKKLYQFEAVWTKNAPTGKQLGSSVEDQVTGDKLEGVLRLNDDGQVTGVYKNSDKSNMNGIGRLEVPENNTATFSVNENSIVARDQKDIFNDLPEDAAEPLQFRMIFGGPVGDDEFTLQYQTVEGDWRGLHDGAGNTVSGQISDITGGDGYTLRRDREVDPAGSNVREGELRLDSNFLSVDNLSNIERGEDGDKIFFQIHKGESEGDPGKDIFEQEGEESKPAFRWGGPNDGSRLVSKPQTIAGSGSLDSVYNYEETAALTSRTNPSMGYSAHFTGSDSYYVTADVNGTKGSIASGIGDQVSAGDSADSGEIIDGSINTTADDTIIQVDDAEAFETGDVIQLDNSDSGGQGKAIVTGKTTGTLDGDTDTDAELTLEAWPAGGDVASDSGGDALAAPGEENNLTLTNQGQFLVNQDGQIEMSKNRDNQLFFDSNLTSNDGADNVAFTSLNNLTNSEIGDPDEELGITIAAENFSGEETANTQINFEVNKGRSVGAETVRPYSLVKDAEGNTAPILMSAGTEDSPGGMTFAPDTAGILDSWSVDSGETAEATLKSDQQVQLAASSDAYDSQGKQHTLSYRFEKQDTNTWLWHVQDPAPVDKDNPEMAGFGKLEFDSEGSYKLSSHTFKSKVAKDRPPGGPQGDLDMNKVWFNPPAETLQGSENEEGAAPVEIDPDFEALTQYGGTSDAEISEQDGNAAGKLESLNFDQTGSLNGSYDNGESRVLAQVALARFRNPEGLNKQGSTYYADSANSGQARFNPPGKGGRGTIAPGSLERSNVDLSAQFTQMISTQRGFQANTKTIRTSDQMIQQLLRLR